MSRDRCEVCLTRLDPDRSTGARRCGEHVDQVALFDPPPLTRLRAARRPGRASTSDTSGDRHHSRAHRARTAKKD